ncbi:sulfotransferase [Glycomyces xiaoerkulensis]|uniref:sulfotransferase n=1 Tax=Glycomyces xiaoerkulensis TaxID=2038139 RepID=UPI000C25CCCD|nr:sulfotransferase [Glycomyces xiaoerkulensis]
MRVIYLLGRGRSGSTIVGKVLGAPDGWFSAGEVRTLWDPVLVQDSPCACGEPVSRCPVWSRVLARLEDLDRGRVARWQHEVLGESRLPRLLKGGSWPALERYREAMARVYAAITEVTGCETIVDTSKRPSYAMVVRGMPGVDPYFVHLVRDPRASAYSWRARRYTGAAGAPVRTRGALDATLRWDLLNLGSETVLHRAGTDRGMRLRYEDFAAAPRAAVDAVAALAGTPPTGSAFLDDRTVQVPASHAIAGNPSGRAAGRVTVRPDGEWRASQRPLDRWLASAAALPFLRRYGYPLRSADR